MAENNWGKRILENLFLEGGKQLVLWAIAPILSVLGIYLGYVEGQPWLYIMVAVATIFAAVVWALVGALIFRVLTTARDRLMIERWSYSVEGPKDDAGRLRHVTRIQPIVYFKNNALFPMSFIIERLDISFEGKIAPKKTHRGISLPLPPNVSNWFRDSKIEMGDMLPKNLTGRAEVKIRYGRPGNERYEIAQQLNLYLPFEQVTGNYGTLQPTYDIQAPGAQSQ